MTSEVFVESEVLATAMRADGTLRVEARAVGSYVRYHVDVWTLTGEAYPHEPQPGYWSERHVSGLYDNLQAAMSDAVATHGVVLEENA